MPKRIDIISLLTSYVRGELDDPERQQLETRLAEDEDTRALLRLIRDLGTFPSEADSPAISKATRKLAEQLFADFIRPTGDKNVPAGVTVFDSALLPLPEGVRPAQIDTRQLHYKVGELDLAIMLYPIAPDSFELMGQLTGDDFSRPTVVTLESKGRPLSAQVDAHGLFRFDRVPVGAYRLVLVSDDTTRGAVDLLL